MACIWNFIQSHQLWSTNIKVSSHKKADKGSKIFYDWYSEFFYRTRMQIYRLDSWLQNVFFFKQEGYINIRGMHNDTKADLAASLWWGSFCLLFVFGSQGGWLQHKISYSPRRTDAATSCVVHFDCIFNFLKLHKENDLILELKFRKFKVYSFLYWSSFDKNTKKNITARHKINNLGKAFTVHIRLQIHTILLAPSHPQLENLLGFEHIFCSL